MRTTPCPTFAECGGCPLIAEPPDFARRHREHRLRDALRENLGQQIASSPIEWIERPQPEGYRRRIRLRIFDDGRVGFFNEAKYRSCAVLSPELRRVLYGFLDGAEQHREVLKLLQHLELREPDLDRFSAAYFVPRAPIQGTEPDILARLTEWLGTFRIAIAGVPGEVPCQRLALPSVWQYVPICSFLQVNARINQALVSSLVAETKRRRLSTFCDLYAGSGNFTLPLLASGLSGCAVELDSAAIAATQRAAAEQGLPRCGLSSGDAGDYAVEANSRGESYDLVVVDPPRAGVRKHLDAMASLCRHSLAYCSCNVRTLARDLATLQACAFELENIHIFDMFEHTEHIETMAWLRRRNSAATPARGTLGRPLNLDESVST